MLKEIILCFVIGIAISFIGLSYLHQKPYEPNDYAFTDIPEDELSKAPEITPLPDEDGKPAGWMFQYTFSKDLNRREQFILAGLVVNTMHAPDMNIDTDGQVVIIAFDYPDKAVSVTLDYLKDEIDLLEESRNPQRPKYRYSVWNSEVDNRLYYFIEGYGSKPNRKEVGRDSGELFERLKKELSHHEGLSS